MSMYLDFEAHSWYMGAVIKDDRQDMTEEEPWTAYIENGWNYTVVTLGAGTLKELKERIKQYRTNQRERVERIHELYERGYNVS